MLEKGMNFVLLWWLTFLYAVLTTAVMLRNSEFCQSVQLSCVFTILTSNTELQRPWSPTVVTIITSSDDGGAVSEQR
jgi:hypothetical protein